MGFLSYKYNLTFMLVILGKTLFRCSQSGSRWNSVINIYMQKFVSVALFDCLLLELEIYCLLVSNDMFHAYAVFCFDMHRSLFYDFELQI